MSETRPTQKMKNTLFFLAPVLLLCFQNCGSGFEGMGEDSIPSVNRQEVSDDINNSETPADSDLEIVTENPIEQPIDDISEAPVDQNEDEGANEPEEENNDEPTPPVVVENPPSNGIDPKLLIDPLQVGAGEKIINAIVGYGDAGTILSCDGGLSWEGFRIPSNVSSGGGDGVSHTVKYHQGQFYYLQGWFGSNKTRIVKSRDGLNWQPMQTGHNTWGITFMESRWIMGDNGHIISDDQGATWRANRVVGPGGKRMRHNKMEQVTLDNGTTRILSIGDDVLDTFAYSDDMGETWSFPRGMDSVECNRDVSVNGPIVVAAKGTSHCYSLDKGETWLQATPGPQSIISLFWTGEKYYLYRRRMERAVETSVDGINWVSHPEDIGLPGGETRIDSHSQFHFDPFSKRFVGFAHGKFIISNDGFDFEEAQVAQSQDNVGQIKKFASGQLAISSGHPCY